MTLVAHSTRANPRPLDLSLLADAPTESRFIVGYSDLPSRGIRYVKRADNDWDERGHPQFPARSSILADVWGRRPSELLNWWLHHPGIVHVGVCPGDRAWSCRLCFDSKDEFDSIGAAITDAKRHVANHAEIARAL